MLKSMTGFGRAETVNGEKSITVEIKSLNGKQMEVSLKIPSLLKSYEFDIRSLLQQYLQRGSVELFITLKQNSSIKPVTINTELVRQYYQSILLIAEELKITAHDILNTILKLPEVVVSTTEALPEKDWLEVKETLLLAIDDLDKHRLNEGGALEKDMLQHIENILAYQEKIKQLEPARKEKIKQRLENLLLEYVGKDKTDNNRLEQELIYYIEKLDISEEQVRLINHCRYFKEILLAHDGVKGKKIGFVLQEIGREINTTGSKANDAGIQQIVVMMKDELEKAKEQVLNVL